MEDNEYKNWKKIASYFQNKNEVQCLHRWQKVLNPTLYKGPWSDSVYIINYYLYIGGCAADKVCF